MNTRRKVIAWGIAGLAIALLIYLLLPSPVPVSAVEVRADHFAEHVEDEGRTRLRDPHEVSAPISAYLRRVELEPGDEVSAGDVLFQLESAPAPTLDARAREQARETAEAARARLEAAEAELERRASELELARIEYERSHLLLERGAISVEERDRRRSRLDAARAAERGARHAIDVARFELEAARATIEIADGRRAPGDQPTLDIPAPFSGTITRRHRRSEGPVGAGEVILELGDLSDLEVVVELLSVDAVRLRPGMRVVFERWGEDAPLEGLVHRIEPAGFEKISALGVEEQRVPVRVDITSPREQWLALGDGYRVEARFIVWEDDDVLQVPTSALFRRDDRWHVFVVRDGRAALREVKTGRRSGLWTQVRDGLEPGETVITHPDDRIADGVRVRPELGDYR